MSTTTEPGPQTAATSPGPGTGPAGRPRVRRAGRWVVRALAGLGALALVGLVVGVVADVQGFDRTRGGLEAPYTGWTGTPTDWDAADVTDDGFRSPGYVLSTTLDCTSGMIGVEAFGAAVDFRVVSERAVAVHQPGPACERHGFSPQF